MIETCRILTLLFNQNPIPKPDFESNGFQHLKFISKLELNDTICYCTPNHISLYPSDTRLDGSALAPSISMGV